ncbi:GAF domain-containing protein [Rhodophyticola porphyridii]|uniref:GAF domain-containing protein n=1 Tax=Rhodophyticola porphyridii TaxID=1852017 RepID=A0A3L9Y4L3_9RHOB|nr:GAF domain-containing protein [Rhodophyticola porphyridii]RMA42268.1 GAF domain-containing protein [Rhodophyticola porphyridii]
MTDLTAAFAASDQPSASFDALARLVEETVGARLFTLLEIDHARGVARRSYSNMPEAYPVSGEKEIELNRWSETVSGRHETFVANSIEEIAEVFPDHALIQSLGCESCINVPVVVGGRVIGTLNCLHAAGHYTPEKVAAAETLKLPGAAAFLLAASIEKGA